MAHQPESSELDVTSLVTVRRAIDILEAEPVAPRTERRALRDVRGLRLAQDLISDRDYPPFDKSLMDGYAVRAADVAATPVDLPVVGEVAAGMAAPRGIGRGEAMAIMTGAPLPPGTECIVPVEQTQEIAAADDPHGKVRILKGVAAGHAMARRGSDMVGGQLVLAKGTILEAAAISVAASVGAAEVEVFCKPRVAVLGTGDEVVPLDQTPEEWQIRNSNNPMLVALLERLGCEVTDLGIVRDETAAIRAAIERGLAFDALFVTGGMSMGNYDYVPATLIDLGVELKITKVRLKPGKPFVFGKGEKWAVGSGHEKKAKDADRKADAQRCFVFGLPGNPVSAFVCTLRLASRLLARMGGGTPQDRWLTGRLEVGLPANGPRELYQPVIRKPPAATKSAQNEFPSIEVLAWRGSADVFTLARANALLVREENEPALPRGTVVRVLEI